MRGEAREHGLRLPDGGQRAARRHLEGCGEEDEEEREGRRVDAEPEEAERGAAQPVPGPGDEQGEQIAEEDGRAQTPVDATGQSADACGASRHEEFLGVPQEVSGTHGGRAGTPHGRPRPGTP
ncbi:hypothetical protein ACFYMX_23680 [Streptomyces griseofuscus]|uniref:hypothetical protein n=1 Tax=Streptomyces griseofuscus TaxID=146922 RepID=UPI0036C27BEE